MDYIAHRGDYTNLKDSNSLKSLKDALDNPKFMGIETDIRVTKDKKYVLYHNAFFKDSLVKNTNYKDMKEENVALLKDLLEIDTDKILLLEIKDFNMDIDRFLNFLNGYGKNVYLMSFSSKVIEKIHKKTSKYKLGVLNYVLNTKDDYKYDFICLLNDILTDYIITSFKKRNIMVLGYGIRKNSKLTYNIPYIIDSKLIE